jgi:predicted CopG family antitoxin
MHATKRIPVREETWKELGAIKEAGQTYDELIGELIEQRKKAKLREDLERIESEGEFVKLDLNEL